MLTWGLRLISCTAFVVLASSDQAGESPYRWIAPNGTVSFGSVPPARGTAHALTKLTTPSPLCVTKPDEETLGVTVRALDHAAQQRPEWLRSLSSLFLPFQSGNLPGNTQFRDNL
jgi:hypothetical protein